ncbi:MAG TPA: glycoside hydrolase family 16 protein [Polyangiaceae bacterium]|nr:glycoside hydrolase family 16 protein [Polyangiaceae bacterium]
MKRLLPSLGLVLGLGAASCGGSSGPADGSGGAPSSAVTGGAAGAVAVAFAGQPASAASGSGGAPPLAAAGSEAVAGSAPSGGASGAGTHSGGASGAGMHSAGSSSGGARSTGGASGSSGGSTGSAGGSAIVAPSGYKLVWHDEFDTDGPPDPATYSFEKGFQRNEEAQWYQSANATVQGGLLVIEARKETVQNPNYTGSGDWKTTRKTAEYTSSSLSTSGHQSFQYGHFEMRARIPTEAGMWPAWWTLGVSGEWPANGEIDIMEFYQSKLLANVACGTDTRWQAKWDSSTKSLSSLGANWASEFHVWTMDWDDQNIVLSVDGQQLNTSALSSMLNADGKSPFKQKAYMIVNLAIGGQNGGDPSKTSFPKRYEIDYLRVFQKQ